MRNALAILAGALPFACLAANDALPPLQDAATTYQHRVAAPTLQRCMPGETVTLAVVPIEGAKIDSAFDPVGGRLQIHYRMNLNLVTEGWNWHPEAALAGEDYYAFKYLPLGTTLEERDSYRNDGMPGGPAEFRVQWRYDYYFAFANPGDFYVRTANDDAGFAAELALPAQDAERLLSGDLRMALTGRLDKDCLAESTTFWKATLSQPVDFTLKKRYLIGALDEVMFYDAGSGQVLARLTRSKAKPLK